MDEAGAPRADRWTALEPLKSPKPNPFAVALGRRIFVVGGTAAGKEDYAQFEEFDGLTDRVEVYDPKADRRSDCAPLPRARGFAGAAAAGERIRLVSGAVYLPDGSLSPVDDMDSTAP